MAVSISYFQTPLSAEYVNKVKQYLDNIGIFDTVVVDTSAYSITCKIGEVEVFKMSNSDKDFTFKNTSGSTIFNISSSGENFNHTCYVGQTDNCVYFSTGNGTSYREFIFGIKDGKAYWVYWYSYIPTNQNNIPRGAFFDATTMYTYPFQTATADSYSRGCPLVLPSASSPSVAVNIYQFIQRQQSLPAINGGSTPYCYKVMIGDKPYLTTGQFLMPYTI